MIRVKHTANPPDVCSGCYWKHLALQRQTINKQLRSELFKYTKTAGKRFVRKPEPRHDEEERDAPDLLDEMSGMGAIKLDD